MRRFAMMRAGQPTFSRFDAGVPASLLPAKPASARSSRGNSGHYWSSSAMSARLRRQMPRFAGATAPAPKMSGCHYAGFDNAHSD